MDKNINLFFNKINNKNDNDINTNCSRDPANGEALENRWIAIIVIKCSEGVMALTNRGSNTTAHF